MPEHFDDALSGVVDSAATAARKPGATAARARGRQRRTRQRLAGSALAVVVIGGAGGIAAISLHGNGSGNVVTADTSASATANLAAASPSPAASDSATLAAATPSSSATPSGSSATSPSPASPTSTSTGQIWSALPQSWLTPSQLPLNGTLAWAAPDKSTVNDGGVAVMEQTSNVYPCIDYTRQYATTTKNVVGFATNGFSATVDVSSNGFDGTPRANVVYIRYKTVADAQSAYAVAKQDVAACSSKDMTDINKVPSTQTATQTAETADAFAYTDILRTDQGNPAATEGNYSNYSDYHGYILRSGNLIEVVYLEGGPVVDPATDDAAALAALVNALG